MPFIFIGTGGMGKETIARIKHLADSAKIQNVFYLGFDIDSAISSDRTADIPLPNICVERPFHDIRALEESENKEFLSWWPKGYTIRTTLCGSTGAGQIRINGRFALFSQYSVVYRHVENVIKAANDISKKDPNDNVIYVFLVSSLGGGTGAGIFMDISFLIRHLLSDKHRFYGIFYDGTITKTYSPNTLNFSYAALGEIEYWMQNFRSFQMTYSTGNRLDGKAATKLFDIIFLIQAETTDGKSFKSTDNNISPYIPMVAESLFSLISIPNFKQFTVSNSWNRFDNLPIKGMQINYASFGMGAITYGQEEVRQYIIHQLIKKFILHTEVSTTPDKSELSFVNVIENPLMISERTDQSLTVRVLRASRDYGSIADRLEGFKRKIAGISKPTEMKQLKSQYKIPTKTTDSIDEWGVFLSKYAEDIKRILYQKRIQFTDKIADEVTRRVRGSSINMIELKGWLDEALGVIQKNENYVLKHKNFPARNITVENIGKTWAALLKDKKLFGGVKVEYKTKLAAAVETWIQSEVMSLEIPAIKDFYAQIRDTISSWKSVIGILEDQIQSIRRMIDIKIGKYTSRDIAYNQDSLASNEFPLHIKLDINKDLIDTFILKQRILDRKDLSNQLAALGDVVHSGKGDLNGISYYFELIAKEVFEGRERQVRTESGIGEGLYQLFNNIIEDKINTVLNDIRIDDILEYWLNHQLYPVAKKYHEENNAKALLDLKQRWVINFGESGADSLTAPKFYSDSEKSHEWFQDALKFFVFNFKSKIRAFVRYGSQIKSDYWEKIGLDQDSRNAFMDKLTVFVPANFRYTELIKAGGDENVLQIKSGFNKIQFYAETYAFPLHSLDLVKGYQEYQVREEYLTHRNHIAAELERGDTSSLLRHIDKRFYADWRIDIGSDETTDVQGYWLYILGMGLGFIDRDDKKKFVLALGKSKKTLDKSLLGTLDKLRQDYHVRESIKSSALDESKSRYFTSRKDYDIIINLFRQAHEKHSQAQPPRTDATNEAFRVWSEIETLIRPLKDGTYPSSSRIPKNWDEMEKLLSSL